MCKLDDGLNEENDMKADEKRAVALYERAIDEAGYVGQ